MAKELGKEELLEMYKKMVRIRTFEYLAKDCFTKGMLAGNIHLSIGQEGSAVGAISALEPTDFITSTHRGHGHCIAKGAETDKMMAEIFGKETGYCKGKGGSMHIADVGLGILGANGIVGAGIPLATGSALASKIKGTDEVTLCIFGDGASNQGTFHESINMAAAWDLPVVYFCECNRYAVSVHLDNVINTDNIAVRAKAYDIPGYQVDGSDVREVYKVVKKAVDHARSGKGPVLVECDVYRWEGHYCGDPANYRPAAYTEKAHEKDPIIFLGKTLIAEGKATQEELDKIHEDIDKEMEAALKFAENSKYPDVSEVYTDMYTDDNERSVMR